MCSKYIDPARQFLAFFHETFQQIRCKTPQGYLTNNTSWENRKT